MAKTYLVTGTSRGLGLEFVKQLVARGDRVIASARSLDSAKAAAELADKFIELDTSSEAAINAMPGDLGGEPIDVLINNAGVLSEDRTIETVEMSEFARVFATNVAGPAEMIKVLLPNLRAGKGKTVVNISSGLGSLATVPPGFGYAYCASKAALNMVTVRTAQDLAKEGFTVVTFSPGWVRTDMGGKDATLAPEESISAMLKTIDGLTPKSNGKFLNYDGGTVAW